MDRAASTKLDILERMLLDESVEPTDLPLSLLEYITNGFSDDKRIGSGGFAVVYKGILRNGTVAVKKLLFSAQLHESKFIREVLCLMKAKHKNVVRILGYCADTQGKVESYDGKLVMADVPQKLLCFEYLPKGSLHDYITDASHELEWTQCYQIIKGICAGLHYLHENYIVHLDLKPTNILFDKNAVPKIADFGLSRCFVERQSHVITSKLCGTLGYIAPEVIHCGRITFKSDMYSLGVIILEILTTGTEDYDILERWGNRLDKIHREKQLEQLRVCTEIGKECTDYDPKRRPDARDVVRRLDEADIMDGYLISPSPNRRFKRTITSWVKGQQLGSGCFGTVYEAISDAGFFFAVKEVSLMNQGLNAKQCIVQLENEISILSRLEHENIVQYFGTDKEGGKLYIFLELVTQGSLAALYQKYHLQDSQVSAYTRQILNGLHYLHQRNVLHRDIKCANILVDASGLVKLVDFGLAKELSILSQEKSSKGTVYWMAPEAVMAKPQGPPADIWSLGCTVLEMMTGNVPYPDLEWTHALYKIGRGIPPEIPNTLSEDARDFIKKCLQANPNDRPSAAQLFEHPFVQRPLQQYGA